VHIESARHDSRPDPGLRGTLAAGLGCLSLLMPANAAEVDLGGDARYYQFLSTDEDAEDRRHAELGILRLKLRSTFTDDLKLEAHGALLFSSPAGASAATSVATGSTRRFLDLEHRLTQRQDLLVAVELDRLNLRWDRPSFRLVAGRQTMTWGVNFFWPVLDLFAPFPPQRIDREYKPGIDALRLTVPVGDLSEIDIAAAGQGKDFPEDFSLAGLGRFHVGSADIGGMAGRFHRDTVLGVFVTADLAGTGVRGEVAFTDSGDAADAEIGRERFWRATAGLDRQLSTSVTLTAEVSYNGFGAAQAEDYPRIVVSDRVRRGEVTSLGRYYAGASLAWRVHPLVGASVVLLYNADDGSVLLQPHGSWSVAQNVVVLLGGGAGLGSSPDAGGQPRSEYGGVGPFFYGAIKAYF